MNRTGYQVLGFIVWKSAKIALRGKYGDAPRKVAAGGAVALMLAALLLLLRRQTA